jgi:hypothetical protein
MFYDCNTFKPISESPHRIQELEEARGELLRVFESEGQRIAVFSWGAVSLPGELQGELQALVGKTVCILRLDGKYHLRVVDDA